MPAPGALALGAQRPSAEPEPTGSARWSEALAGLLPQFSGWRTPSGAPSSEERTLVPAPAPGGLQELPKVRQVNSIVLA